MVDLLQLERAARKTTDEHGNPVVQIPLDVWEELVEFSEPPKRTEEQVAKLQSLIDYLMNTPDDKSGEWWDEFDALLKEKPLDLNYQDILGEDE